MLREHDRAAAAAEGDGDDAIAVAAGGLGDVVGEAGLLGAGQCPVRLGDRQRVRFALLQHHAAGAEDLDADVAGVGQLVGQLLVLVRAGDEVARLEVLELLGVADQGLQRLREVLLVVVPDQRGGRAVPEGAHQRRHQDRHAGEGQGEADPQADRDEQSAHGSRRV
ncbi:hypothetical protein ACFQZC_16210 [Streptacidiphilus monticola]